MRTTAAIPASIAPKVRALRTGRGLTQAELAQILDLSQNRLSEIERGQGSFSAEQFLTLLGFFNVPLAHFAPQLAPPQAPLQNALARLGAHHLVEAPGLLPSERLQQASDLIREVLTLGDNPRHLTALAPVLVANLDHLNLPWLWSSLSALGLERRLGWLLDNTREALRKTPTATFSPKEIRSLKRPQARLATFLAQVERGAHPRPAKAPEDVLGAPLLSLKSLDEARHAASPISRRWGILSNLHPGDFREALHAARLAH